MASVAQTLEDGIHVLSPRDRYLLFFSLSVANSSSRGPAAFHHGSSGGFFVVHHFVLSVIVAFLVSKCFRIKTDLSSILLIYRGPENSVEDSCAQK